MITEVSVQVAVVKAVLSWQTGAAALVFLAVMCRSSQREAARALVTIQTIKILLIFLLVQVMIH